MPFNMLVTIGSRLGPHLLIDLERLHPLSIGGHRDKARDLLRHIVCELGSATWSAHTTVLLAGFGDEGQLLTQISPDRIRTVASQAVGVATIRNELR